MEFGGVGLGKGVARIGIRINRNELDLAFCDEFFSARRLTVLLRAETPDRNGQRQKELVKDLHHEVAGTFDAKQFSVNPLRISTSLSFALKEIEVEELAHLANSEGMLYIRHVEAIEPAPEDDEEEEEEAEPGDEPEDAEEPEAGEDEAEDDEPEEE